VQHIVQRLEVVTSGGQLWLRRPDWEPAPRTPRGKELVKTIAAVQDVDSAASAAGRCGWLWQAEEIGEWTSDHLVADLITGASIPRETGKWVGEPVQRWLRAGQVVRQVTTLLDAADDLARGKKVEVSRRTIRDLVSSEPSSVLVNGTVSMELRVPVDPEWQSWAKGLRVVQPEDAVLIGAAYLGASLRLFFESQKHVALSASRSPHWPAPVATDLYGALLIQLADELGRSARGLAREQVRPCQQCGNAMPVMRENRKRFCSDSCRSLSRYYARKVGRA